MVTPPPRPQPGRPAPAPGLLRRLEAAARTLFPPVSGGVLMILAAAPVGLPSTVEAVTLPVVFFWSIFRPASMSPPAVFLLGLLQDLLTMSPFGTGVLTLLVLHAVALRFRSFIARQSFLVVWVLFCLFAQFAAVLDWALQALLALRFPPADPMLWLCVIAAGLYPGIALVLTRVHGAMRRAEGMA